MERLFLVLLIGLMTNAVFGFSPKKEETDFQKNFNIAKQHLSQRKIDRALPYLLYLNKEYPENSNLKYLIGVCYAELEVVHPQTLKLLNEASVKTSLEYDPNSLEEERVPIYVYYYLSISYAQNKMCEEAEGAREKFLKIYPHKDAYYIDESLRWLTICNNMEEEPEEEALPEFPDFVPYTSEPSDEVKQEEAPVFRAEKKQETKTIEIPQKIVTKKIEYSTKYPLYGVQLGAFKEVVPVSRFKAMKNVDAFMDNEGLIRYVVGHFSINSQAESLLKYIRSLGYTDAFVVNVNNHKKFSDEVISVNNVNIRANPTKVEYRIQIGAFRENIPRKTASMYSKIEGIKEHQEGELTYLTAGKFKTYLEAKAYSQGIIDAGVTDAFVIALANGRKVSLQQANEF